MRLFYFYKKLSLLSILLFVCSSVSAQEIKISKGVILLDKVPVARIEGKLNEPQLVSTLDGKPVFKMEVTSTTKGGIEAPEAWTAFYTPDGVRTLEAKVEGTTGFTLSQKKILVGKLLAMTPAFLTKEGLQTTAIAQCLSTNSLPFSQHWDSVYSIINQQFKAGREWSKNHKIEIENSGDIKIEGRQVGHISIGLNKSNFNTIKTYSVYDMEGNKIATLEAVVNSDGSCKAFQEIKMYDGKIFGLAACRVDNTFLSLDGPAQQIVERLMTNGYPLPQMPTIIARQKAEAAAAAMKAENEKESNELAEAKKNSINLYDIPAKVIFSDGSSAVGKITLLYENIEQKMGKPKSGIIDLDIKYGSSAELLTSNGDKMRLKAKDGMMITVGDRKFIGTKSVGDTGLGYINAGDAIAVVTKPANFFEVVYEDGKGNFIVYHPLAPEDFLLKLNGKEEAIYLGEKGMVFKRSLKKIQSSLDKYLKSKTIKAEQYQDFSLAGLKKIIADYNMSGNK